jgi:hypothetical protein
MKNRALDKELKDILANPKNIVSVTKNVIGDQAAIDVAFKEPVSIDSFLYKGKTAERDADFDKLNQLMGSK